MSKLDLHVDHPDVGVLSSDLFVYKATEPGTGGLVSIVKPDAIEDRVTVFLDSPEMRVTFLMDRDVNTAVLVLTHKLEPPTQDVQGFRLTPEFQTKDKVSLNILFSEWKIIALIDGEPLKKKG